MAEWSFHFNGKAGDVAAKLKAAKGGPAYTKALGLARAFHAACPADANVSIAATDNDQPGTGFNFVARATDVREEKKK
jgi:hypothetical protein